MIVRVRVTVGTVIFEQSLHLFGAAAESVLGAGGRDR